MHSTQDIHLCFSKLAFNSIVLIKQKYAKWLFILFNWKNYTTVEEKKNKDREKVTQTRKVA